MIRVRLPDGSERSLPDGATAKELAEAIGPRLARDAVAARVNGRLVDLATPLADGDEVQIVTLDSPEGLEVLRHSAAHLLAMAVKRLYPEAQVAIGPVIEDGFYYDFAYARPFTPEDLERIEAEMKRLAAEKIPIERRVMPR
ncbi:MAG: TGS domain-containing protein, partial [Zetaproteobacteria bacterium]